MLINHNHSRRRVIRSLLVTGCALCLTTHLSPAQSGKISKMQAQYQDQPKDDQKCGNCTYFIEPNSCMMVDGNIKPKGWCKFWVKKPG